MPSRILKESICTSESLAYLSAEAEVLFYRLIVKVDDFGLYYGSPKILASLLFPLNVPTEKKVSSWLAELVNGGLVATYRGEDGRQYLKLLSWDKHQNRRATKPKYPLPQEFDNTCSQEVSNDNSDTCAQMQADSSVNVFENVNEKRKRVSAQRGAGVDDTFDQFWSVYPRKVGKKDAVKVWNQIRPNRGVRPALYLESGNLVSDSTDTDGAYILQWNQPPSDPSSISYGTPQAGNSLVLSTGGSTDPEGDAISYVWERKIDSGAYVQLGITTAKTFTDTVPTSGTTYTARVKAVDSNGLESGYCTGSAKTISYNTPPVISGSDQNLGVKTAPFTYQYTVTDAQAATQTITVTEKLTNGTQTIALRTYTATSGAQNTVDLSSVWLPLLSGTHVLTITATDSAGGSATRKITFSRTVSRIAAARAFNTDALVQKVFVSLYPATIPADATLHLEVTNNPFDTSPVWVDITDKANRLVHVFTNTTAAKGYGLGYRFYITKGTQEIEITQATIRFA